jgi:hypothetical protein
MGSIRPFGGPILALGANPLTRPWRELWQKWRNTRCMPIVRAVVQIRAEFESAEVTDAIVRLHG